MIRVKTIKNTIIKALSSLEKDHQLRDLLHSVKKLPESKLQDLIEQFRAFELLFSDQKKAIQDYKYSLEKIDLEIARLADSSSGESKITLAIQMANQGKSISEISEATNLSTEEVEPIIKYHGKV